MERANSLGEHVSLRKPLLESTRHLIETSIINGESGEYLMTMFTSDELDAYFSNPDAQTETVDAA